MKRRLIALIAVVLAMLILLAGCGSAAKNAAAADTAWTTEAAEEPRAEAEEFKYAGDGGFYDMETSEPQQANGTYANAKLIKRASIGVQTLEFDSAVKRIENLTASLGGYVESNEIYSGGYNSGNTNRSAYFVVRIPAEQYDAFLSAVDGDELFHVTDVSKYAEDVGAEYFDTEVRLKTQKIKQARLQELLEKADNMEDIISLENALSDVEYMIENYTSTLNRYDDLVGFSTISVNVDQVTRVTDNTEDTGFGSRLANAFRHGFNSFANFMEEFAVWLASAILPILVIAVILVIVVVIVKRRRRRKTAAVEAPKEEKTEE